MTKKNILITTIGFFGLTVFFTFPLLFHMSTGVYGPFFDSDIRGAVWQLWWAKYAMSHGLDYFLCPFLAAPFGVSLGHAPISWMVYALFNFLLRFLNPLACLNILILVSFILTAVFSSRLIYRLTQSAAASFLGAVIFAFAPYHLNKVMEFSFFFLGNWFVLFVLSLFFLREKMTFVRVVLSGCALGLTAGFNPYYGFFAGIFAVFFFIYDSFFSWRTQPKKIPLLLLRAVFFLMILLGVAAVINANVVVIVFRGFLDRGPQPIFQSGSEYFRPMDYLIAQSARPLNYLLPASTHPLLGGLTRKMFGSFFYGRGSIEQTLYLGWIPLILAFIAYREWKKRRAMNLLTRAAAFGSDNYWIGFFLFAAWASFLFSLPPVLNLGIAKIYFPSYFTYKILPMFRAYARFGMITMLCVSVLASFGFKFVLQNIDSQKKKIFLTIMILFGVLFEFTQMPPTRVTDISKPSSPAYVWLKNQKEDLLVAEYPMTKGAPGEALENYDYLFQQTIHHKRLVNGAVAGTAAYKMKERIFTVDDPQTPGILKTLGVRVVFLHNDLYRKGARSEIAGVQGVVPDLEKIKGYHLLKAFEDISIFEVTADPFPQSDVFGNKEPATKGSL